MYLCACILSKSSILVSIFVGFLLELTDPAQEIGKYALYKSSCAPIVLLSGPRGLQSFILWTSHA